MKTMWILAETRMSNLHHDHGLCLKNHKNVRVSFRLITQTLTSVELV